MRRRPEMDERTAETGDDGRTSLQLDLGDAGSYVDQLGLELFIVGQRQIVKKKEVNLGFIQTGGEKLHISGQRPTIQSYNVMDLAWHIDLKA